jgi:uncharacterized membrane protein YidH (DUF202 family)
MTDPPIPERSDHGAAAERTRLAWRRTVLSGTIVGLLAVRPAFAPRADAAAFLLAAAAMVGWTILVAFAYRRNRGLAAAPPQPGRGSIPASAWITVGFAILGGLVVLR